MILDYWFTKSAICNSKFRGIVCTWKA